MATNFRVVVGRPSAAGYSVERCEFGIIVRGEPPLDDFLALAQVWKEQGLTRIAVTVASAIHASFAVTSPENEQAWFEQVQRKAQEEAGGDAELAWFLGPDTGTSSLTTFYVLTEMHKGRAWSQLKQRGDIPYDPDDFGRCRRLLKLFPLWRARLPEVAEKYPEWAPFVRDWDKLDALYEEEVPHNRGEAPRLYEAMKQCVVEAGK